MKAFLLAAGCGTRLRPLTFHTPKCLIPIAGKPLLQIWFELLEQHGIDEVLINTHHLADRVLEFVQSLDTPIQTHLTYEPKLLGSAGTLRHNRDFVQSEPFFWVIYADGFTTANLTNLLRFHQQTDSFLTLGLFHTKVPRESGIVTLDPRGRIVDFVEKPTNPPGDLANAGIMVGTPSFLDQIPDRYPCDLSFDVLPYLVGRMYGRVIDDIYIDIGTPENHRLAQTKYKHISQSQMAG
jgi:mannose-1-phosphate guanylyltransferase